jgi:hypothetical protein
MPHSPSAPHPHGHRLADFAPLRPAEETLREACRKGEFAKIGSGERPEEPTPEITIRAEVLRVFCLGHDPQAAVHEHGVQLAGAWIEGNLDLEGAELPRRLAVLKCEIAGTVVVYDAVVLGLCLDGARCNGIVGDGLRCRGDVFLRDGFVTDGTVRLLGARIQGDLGCMGGHFEATENDALSCDRAEIRGSVFLNESFLARREVRFLNAEIGGNLDCTDGHFEATESDALSCDGVEIRGSVFMDEGFVARGAVRFLGARIRGKLSCMDGRFEAERSLSLDRAEIEGVTHFRDGFHAAGVVTLACAALGDLADDEAAWETPTLVLDGATYRSFAGGAPVDAARRIRWLDRQPIDHLKAGFCPQPWEQCAAVLAAMGHERDAVAIRVEKRRRMRRSRWSRAATRRQQWFALWPAIWDRVLDVTVLYGFRPSRSFYGLFGLWLLAGAAYAFLVPNEVMAPTDARIFLDPTLPAECRVDWIDFTGPTPPRPDDALRRADEAQRLGLPTGAPWPTICRRQMPSEHQHFAPWWYALDLMLPIVDLRQEHDWAPRTTDAAGDAVAPLWAGASWGWGHLARIGEWILILAGWFLSAMLVGAVTGVIRRG